jgi:hypothetical protein
MPHNPISNGPVTFTLSFERPGNPNSSLLHVALGFMPAAQLHTTQFPDFG